MPSIFSMAADRRTNVDTHTLVVGGSGTHVLVYSVHVTMGLLDRIRACVILQKWARSMLAKRRVVRRGSTRSKAQSTARLLTPEDAIGAFRLSATNPSAAALLDSDGPRLLLEEQQIEVVPGSLECQVALDGSGTLMVTGGGSGVVELFAFGEKRSEPPQVMRFSCDSTIFAVALSAEADMLAVGAGADYTEVYRVWRDGLGRPHYEPWHLVHVPAGKFMSLAFGANKLVIGGKQLMTLVDVQSGATLRRLARSDKVRCVALSASVMHESAPDQLQCGGRRPPSIGNRVRQSTSLC